MKKTKRFSVGHLGMKANLTITKASPDEKHTMIKALDIHKGAYFCSSFEYPGRYTRWDMGFNQPPIEIRTLGRQFTIEALHTRGELIVKYIAACLQKETYLQFTQIEPHKISGVIHESTATFTEELRSKQPSVFSLIRSIRDAMFVEEDRFLGLYGAFGYDLIFQFENINLKRQRNESSDMVLYFPDHIFVIDHQKGESFYLSYEFEYDGESTRKTSIDTISLYQDTSISNTTGDLPAYQEGEYAKKVDFAKQYFIRGDLFEVVPSHTFQKKCDQLPSQLFLDLKRINPSPYGFLINIGDEYLIGASPEMYVRVEGRRVETCPISGTIPRGKNAIEDAERIKELLGSKKDESELTMCTDVDRNDKSRICVPGSVKVIGRRQIEMYSHLIHTVDHVEGILDTPYDALDAFMTHMWAVTVTGAPKKAAIQWIEDNEDSNRIWYGGAVGHIGCNGNINTGLTLRTIRLRQSIAEVRVGATILYDSISIEEEKETIVKAAALMKVIEGNVNTHLISCIGNQVGEERFRRKVLFVDHEDSFVHTLASYFRKAGCEVETLRHHVAREALQTKSYDLVVLSPGPGTPSEFHLHDTIELCVRKTLPIFGVCLGLQGLIEYFGGELGVLGYPVHGKQSLVSFQKETILFQGIETLKVGRYHSLYGKQVPEVFKVVAKTEDGIVMAIENEEKNIYAVQFHPESIMTMEDEIGYKIIQNVLRKVSQIR